MLDTTYDNKSSVVDLDDEQVNELTNGICKDDNNVNMSTELEVNVYKVPSNNSNRTVNLGEGPSHGGHIGVNNKSTDLHDNVGG